MRYADAGRGAEMTFASRHYLLKMPRDISAFLNGRYAGVNYLPLFSPA